MIFKKNYYFKLLLTLIFFNSSCKKERVDSIDPVIKIVAPYYNQNLSFRDTIFVEANITDERNLSYVKWSLSSEDNVFISSKTYETSGKAYELLEQIYLDRPELKSGIYYLLIAASDGVNEIKKFAKLNISEIPKQRKGVFIITSNGISTNIEHADQNYLVTTKAKLGLAFNAGSLSITNAQYYFLGSDNQSFHAIDLYDYKTMWTLLPATVYPYQDVANGESTVFLSDKLGYISGYEVSGNKVRSFKVQEAYYPVKLIVSGDFIVSELAAKTGSSRKLSSNYIESGAGSEEVIITDTVHELYNRYDSEVAVFFKNGNQPGLKFYKVNENQLYSYQSLPSGTIKGTARINEDIFLFCINNQIYKYQVSTNNLVPYLLENAEKMNYDDVNNELFIASKNQLKIHDYATAKLKATLTTTMDIKEISFFYNK